ncbi:MAG: PD-(D/E)XK nuclease family protein [Coriobacteriia bacterium]|nr:PD-(D/E)XK nuclease family protein [Coriobacteriia bacterium]
MGLTLVTGRANSGKTGVVYDAVREAAGAGRSPALLLPTYPDVVRATDELSHAHPMGVHIAQFDRWVGEAWSLYGDGRRPVEDEQRSALLRDAIGDTRMRVLSRSATTPGFIRLMSYVALRASEEPRLALDTAEPRSAADAETISLLRAYRTRLDGTGLIEPGEAALRLASAPPDGPPLFVHRFTDLGRAQEALLVALAGSRDVWLSLPGEADCPATEALDGLVGRLSSLGTHRHCAIQGSGADPELLRFEAGLFHAPDPGPTSGSVTFCTAVGEEAEAALIAERAARAAATYGPDRVAIVFRDAARHIERLRVALAGAGVGADFDVLVSAARTPYGAAVDRLLGFTLGSQDPTGLLTFLRSPFSGADPASIDELDARWRARRTTTREQMASDASRSGLGPGRALKLARQVCGRPLSAASSADWQELAGTLLAAAHDTRSFQDDPEAALDAAAHRALLETVSRLAEVDSTSLSCADVLDAFAEARVSPGVAERPGRVQITEAHRLRARRFDAVIVGGLNAGDFSAEGRSSAAAEIADRIFGTTRPTEQALERLLFYDVCTRARKQLVLTRQMADSEGTSKRPSVFWEEALDLYRRPDADIDAGEADAVITDALRLADLHRAAPALTPGRAQLRAHIAAGDAPGGDPRITDAIARGRVRRGQLRDPETLSELAARDEFSATELETYARCPYGWFYTRAVHPQSLDVTLDPLARGDLAHRTLAGFYTELSPRLGTPRVTPETLPEALLLVDEVFQSAAASPRTPPPVTLAEHDDLLRVHARVRALVAADIDFLPGFAPAHAELRFGTAREGQEPPPTGRVDLGGFLLRGSIDRVDEGETGLVVIDYKSGAVPKRADFRPERVLQVPLYAAVAARALGRPVLAGLYRSLKDASARGFYLKDAIGGCGLTSTDAVESPEAVAAIVEAAIVTAREAASGIRAGAIPARPASPGACTYCPAAPFCGREV